MKLEDIDFYFEVMSDLWDNKDCLEDLPKNAIGWRQEISGILFKRDKHSNAVCRISIDSGVFVFLDGVKD